MDISTEDTMPDDAWKDSFDKLLDQRPILRQMNVIKREVRTSFNLNSSYENSTYNNSGSAICSSVQQKAMNSSSLAPPNVHYIDVSKTSLTKRHNNQRVKSKISSTPLKNDSVTNPFKCTLSPIGSWDLRNIKSNDKENARKYSKLHFNAAPVIHNVVINVDYSGDSKAAEKDAFPSRYSLGISPLELVRKKWKSKPNQKKVFFALNNSVEKEKTDSSLNKDIEIISPPLPLKVCLQPGKWRKSLNCLRRAQKPTRDDANALSQNEKYRKGRSTGVVERAKSLRTSITVASNRKSIYIRATSEQTQPGSRSTYSLEINDFKRQILERCGQRRILSFSSAYNEDYLQNCCKIGEGAFGEVFVYSNLKRKNCEKTVLKIIPIEGKELVNGEVQKTFEQILPEIIISMELGRLNDEKRKTNVTSGFVNLQRVRCVKGRYPLYLQKLWEDYDLKKESENDHPKLFTNNQQYIILELAYGGKDLEGFDFKNAEQSFYALQQIILTLAVGEREYQFEHRDLHWGNILINNTNQQYVSYKLEDNTLTIPTKGIKITIIDYTLSRMTFNDYCFYNDLSQDEELFTATGDYQFEIYRMMQNVLNNKWETYEPKTNILWISYIISKLVEGVTYKNKGSKNHLNFLGKLRELQTSILTYKSCADYALNVLLC